MADEGLGDGWVVWSEEDARSVLTYRPDVFDGGEYPASCLPTIYVTRGGRNRRPGVDLDPPADAKWTVTLLLEPEVEVVSKRTENRERALAVARDLTARFADGEVDYRAAYHVTADREDYLAALDALTGREP